MQFQFISSMEVTEYLIQVSETEKLSFINVKEIGQGCGRIAEVRVSSFEYKKWAYSMFPAYSVKLETRVLILDDKTLFNITLHAC